MEECENGWVIMLVHAITPVLRWLPEDFIRECRRHARLPAGGSVAMDTGKEKISWARQYMPVLSSIAGEFRENQPLKGVRIGMALHVEAKTACLVEALAGRRGRRPHHGVQPAQHAGRRGPCPR